ncbi:MAG: hypothetical protein ABH879_00230 [archaeon]
MREFYVIVHEGDLDLVSPTKRSIDVLEQLDDIRRTHPEDYKEIKVVRPEYLVPDGLPASSQDLRVIVCGAYAKRDPNGEACCNAQVRALRRRGYNAELHPTACMYADPLDMIRDIQSTLARNLERMQGSP